MFSLYQKPKKISYLVSSPLFVLFVHFVKMSTPKFATKDLKVGKGFIIGRNNIEEFFKHVNGLRDFNDKPLVKLTHSYESAIASLVAMIEARFVNLNPII